MNPERVGRGLRLDDAAVRERLAGIEEAVGDLAVLAASGDHEHHAVAGVGRHAP